jgi:hypothetical protein
LAGFDFAGRHGEGQMNYAIMISVICEVVAKLNAMPEDERVRVLETLIAYYRPPTRVAEGREK